jgi:hypothetical protein
MDQELVGAVTQQFQSWVVQRDLQREGLQDELAKTASLFTVFSQLGKQA